MRKGSGLVLAIALAVPAAFGAPLLVLAPVGDAFAEAPARGRRDAGEDRRDPNNVSGIARWMEHCVDGNAKLIGRDPAGAVESYKAAIKLAPRHPMPYYLLGEAHVVLGNLDEASKALEAAEPLSDKRDVLLRAKILFVLADLRERQHRWEDAKAGWQAYTEWVFAQSDGGTFPLSAVARVKALDDQIKLDKATQIVRDRIAAAVEAGAFNSPADPPREAGAAAPAKR